MNVSTHTFMPVCAVRKECICILGDGLKVAILSIAGVLVINQKKPSLLTVTVII